MQSVSPDDNTAPVISDCPNDITVDLPTGVTTAVVSWTEPTATDNSGVIPSVTRTHPPMSTFSVGTTQVTYTFTDQAGNADTCVFAVMLNGNCERL